MCSICGIVDFHESQAVLPALTEKMSSTMEKRGPDQSGSYFDTFVSLHHNRLAIMDVEHGQQPMSCFYRGNEYTIVYNGELYNTKELKNEIIKSGIHLKTQCDTEVVLYAYVLWGEACVELLNGIFSFAIYDKEKHYIFLARDRFGVKPLFYSLLGTTFVFASEMKALLQHPNIHPNVELSGFWQLIFLSPVTLKGETIFRDIFELEPGCKAIFNQSGLHITKYWSLEAKPFMDTKQDAIQITKDLLEDAITRQLVSDVPLCTLLSGGLDSSIVSAVAAREYKKAGKKLSTYSFEYEGNKENFKTSLFQPQGDDEYALLMSSFIQSEHTVIQAPTEKVKDLLYDATLARDMPGQSDIDSSLLYYCNVIKKKHTVTLSGECADEIFGGYPWFYRSEMLEKPFFPWIHDPMLRANLFSSSIKADDGYHYLSDKYKNFLSKCPILDNDSETMRASRKATWLSVNLFMASLLERKDRMSMAASVEVRVPFADHRILEYVYNVPWEIKFENNVEKALLRNAMQELLPFEIRTRKKSPYPKTHNPEYERLVTSQLAQILKSQDSRIAPLLDAKRLSSFLEQEGSTWFGQLMSKPQLIAWLIQLEYWLTYYHVNLI
ncbi:MAG: asparagine synthase (glutamine-hydrolyzing) [Velocimicrobium sp.]